ncbi:MAG: monovalent cation/H+ antiporter subunit D, partial [Rhizobacter sp.]|nr:monovalent cation/H+ antiporter subunit D [Rhizobacter sp.]
MNLADLLNALFTSHLPILPVLLPAGTAMLLLLLGDAGGDTAGVHVHRRRVWARRIALASATLGLLLAARLALEAHAGVGALKVYRLGEWPAPFGIVLVIDRLSALMLVLTSCVALP